MLAYSDCQHLGFESTGVLATQLDETGSDTLLAQLRVEMTALAPYKTVCLLRFSEFGIGINLTI